MSDSVIAGPKSADILAQSERYFPGGVNSPVRGFRAVGGNPIVVSAGRGSRVTDVDGRVFLDYIGSWGALILGHAADDVVTAIHEMALQGTSFGMPTPYEVELAKLIHAAMPAIESMRFVNSGTEATMSAIRAARGFTRRDKIVKFAGCYHGHADALLVQAGSGVATLGLPSSAGVPNAAAADTLVAPYNNLDALSEIFAAYPREIAAVIMEPVAANMGVVRPVPGFLEGLREVTQRHGALLIFDEVITGFRVARGGAQARYHVTPDLTCLGKIVGGGLPIGAYGGRREVMDAVAPLGPVYQAGTLAGNPLAVTAGAATLRRLRDETIYTSLELLGRDLAEGLTGAAAEAEVQVAIVREASMLTMFFTSAPPDDYTAAVAADTAQFAAFFHAMLNRGVLLPPSQFEAWFVSAAHTRDDIRHTIEVARSAFGELRRPRPA